MLVKLKEVGVTSCTCAHAMQMLDEAKHDLTPGNVYLVTKQKGNQVELKGWGCLKFDLSLFEIVSP